MNVNEFHSIKSLYKKHWIVESFADKDDGFFARHEYSVTKDCVLDEEYLRDIECAMKLRLEKTPIRTNESISECLLECLHTSLSVDKLGNKTNVDLFNRRSADIFNEMDFRGYVYVKKLTSKLSSSERMSMNYLINNLIKRGILKKVRYKSWLKYKSRHIKPATYYLVPGELLIVWLQLMQTVKQPRRNISKEGVRFTFMNMPSWLDEMSDKLYSILKSIDRKGIKRNMSLSSIIRYEILSRVQRSRMMINKK